MLVCAWLSTVASAVGQEGGAAKSADEQLVQLMDAEFEASMRAFPTWASARGDRRYDALLTDQSPQAVQARLGDTRKRLASLGQIKRADLSPANGVNAALFEHELKRRLEGAKFQGWQQPINQLGGPQRSLPQMPKRMTFKTPKQREDFLLRLEAIPAYLAQTVANLEAGLKAGRTPPKTVMGEVAAQALAQGDADDPTTHALYAPFADATEELRARAQRVIKDQVAPAFRRLGAFLRDTYVPGCRASIGASESVDGAAFYAYQLKGFTTTDASAQQVHETGLKEVARIRSEMFEVIGRSDFSKRDALEGDALFVAFTGFLRTEPRFFHKTAQDLLDGYRALAKRIDAHLPSLFRQLPRLPYGVREMPAFIAPTSPTAYYYRGSKKNGVPGYFIANTHKLDQRPRYEMIPLTLHEAVPGHHLQIALAQEQVGVPRWRKVQSYTVFVEGWALYAERLGLEMGDDPKGLYADPYDEFGRLSYEMWRAMRLVVDTGLHAKQWTRTQAIDYMLANSALTRENVEREVDRYIVWPGQAVAYKTGELKIRELRAKAERTLGDRFDLRRFHDAVLAQGSVPLHVLERIVDAWIAKRSKTSKKN